MADTLTSSRVGKLIIPLQNGDEKTTRAITIEDPIIDVDSINSALADITDWMRNSTVEAIRWAIQPSSWLDFDPSSIQGGGTSSGDETWSISAADPFVFEVTDKTVRKYSENYSALIETQDTDGDN